MALVDLAWLARLVVLAGFAVLLGVGISHFVWRRRRTLPALARIDELAPHGYAGLDVAPIYDKSGGLALTTRSSAPEGSAFLLDTEPDAVIPEGLAYLRLGVSSLDTTFHSRGATEAAARGLEASRAQLEATSDFIAGWGARLSEVHVTTDQVRFVFDRDQLTLFERALPPAAHFAGIVLSAVRWYPPSELRGGGEGAFRQAGGDQATSRWFVEAAGGRAGPFTLPEVIALLQQGRVSWLTRASLGEEGPLLPLARHDALAPVRVPVTEPAAPPTPASPAPMRPIRRAVLALAQLYSVAGLLWLMLAIAALFAEPNLRRATHGKASVGWPSTTGQIIGSRLVTDHGSEDERYRAAVRYGYSVDGVRHVGDRVRFYYRWRFDDHYYDRAFVEEIVSRYPVGREVKVYYQPGAPENSVLEPGLVRVELVTGRVALGFMGLAVVLLLFMAGCRLHAWRLRRRADRAAAVPSPPDDRRRA
jgi:hypothetical protein